MGNEVYADGMEIACKAGAGKSICAFPDVCFTPPQTPATPPGVPIPYPNTGMASDTTDGSKKVKISDKEVMLKNKSSFKKSTGDEAGSAPKKGVVTSKNTGKVFFNMWSMDVKVEGENVVRHFDLTTHNHGSVPGNTPPWPYADRMAMALGLSECQGDIEKATKACDPWEEKSKCPDSSELDTANQVQQDLLKDAPADKAARRKWKSTNADYKAAVANRKKAYENYAKKVSNDPCHRALKCILTEKGDKDTQKCCRPQSPHHLVDGASFKDVKDYDYKKAPCICAEGPDNTTATHGLLHTKQRKNIQVWNKANPGAGGKWTVKDASASGAKAVGEVYPNSACNEGCIQAQLEQGHKNMGIQPSQKIPQTGSGAGTEGTFAKDWEKYNDELRDMISNKAAKSGRTR